VVIRGMDAATAIERAFPPRIVNGYEASMREQYGVGS